MRTFSFMLKPGMNEYTKYISADKRSGPEHFPIFLNNKNLPVLMPLNDFLFRIEIFKELNGPDRIDQRI